MSNEDQAERSGTYLRIAYDEEVYIGQADIRFFVKLATEI